MSITDKMYIIYLNIVDKLLEDNVVKLILDYYQQDRLGTAWYEN